MTYENENKYTDIYDTTTSQVANDIHAESHGSLSFEEANELAVQELRRIDKATYEIRQRNQQACRGNGLHRAELSLPQIMIKASAYKDTRRYHDF